MSFLKPHIKIGDRIVSGFQNGIYKHTDEYSDDGTCIVRINDYGNDGTKKFECLKRVNLSKNEIDRFSLKHNDILINRVNSLSHVGKSCIIEDLNDTVVFESNMMRLRLPSTSGISPKYLFIVLNSARARDYLRKVAKPAVAQASINQEDIRSLVVFLPSIYQQAAIASLISTWDLAIEKTERLIAAKLSQLKALTQDLLTGNKRIKGHDEKWRKHRLSEVLTEHREVSSGREEVHSVSVHKGLINQIEHLGRVYAAKNTSNYNLVKPGDVVYTKSPTGDFPYGIVKQSRIESSVIVSPLYGVFTPRSQQLGTFLSFYFESPIRTANYLTPIIQKGAKNTINITNATFLSNSLYLPTCDEEAKSIADLLNTAQQEIDLLNKQAEAYRKQKRGLMQRLLIGEWRLKAGDGRS